MKKAGIFRRLGILGVPKRKSGNNTQRKGKGIVNHLSKSIRHLDKVIQDIREKLENSSELEDVSKTGGKRKLN